jgi:hypothetical protein
MQVRSLDRLSRFSFFFWFDNPLKRHSRGSQKFEIDLIRLFFYFFFSVFLFFHSGI